MVGQPCLRNKLGKNILDTLNERTHLQYEFLQFKNLYGQLRTSWQTWTSPIKNTGTRYDPDAKTFTFDDSRWGFNCLLLTSLFIRTDVNVCFLELINMNAWLMEMFNKNSTVRCHGLLRMQWHGFQTSR